MKTCNKCQVEKEESDYYTAQQGYKRNTCKRCILDRNVYLKRNRRTTKRPETKGYDTFVNSEGVKCITNFDPYNLGKKGNYHVNSTEIKAKSIPRTLSSDIISW